MKRASVILILYSVSMVFYGSLEMVHDILHYLAEHHHSMFHNHTHGHSHNVRDHEHEHEHIHQNHSHLSDHQEPADNPEQSLPTLVNIFLFSQTQTSFHFSNSRWVSISNAQITSVLSMKTLPVTPPPEYFVTVIYSNSEYFFAEKYFMLKM